MLMDELTHMVPISESLLLGTAKWILLNLNPSCAYQLVPVGGVARHPLADFLPLATVVASDSPSVAVVHLVISSSMSWVMLLPRAWVKPSFPNNG
jgi:hypothetical protein